MLIGRTQVWKKKYISKYRVYIYAIKFLKHVNEYAALFSLWREELELSRLDYCNDEVQGQFINLLKIERFILKWHTTEYKSQIQSP